ncbi:MAG: ABC transporter permease [Chloroflexi bacterium]|nr:ABC transporter permease [Chloroflexota bacterium]MCI0830417.1 ABC transporter permease [Chloroflexota bacterium]MCI0897478.1 ABC transporter permease [Chloroflexota bacterium]MCI0900986.1 ABC transporter permease [Chloroflexota bacterium]MCI0903890.1 ABC transporter permease [Chloroflexota bacterium]
MRAFSVNAVEQADLATQLRVKPTGVAAVWSWLWNFTRRKPIAAAGGVVLVLAILVAIFAPVLAPHAATDIGVAPKFAGPGAEGTLLGTDQLGRDIFSRLIYGARVSMYVGVVSVLIGITFGTLVGVTSAYAGGWVDIILQRLVDALMGFPPIILALGLMAALGASTNNVVIALIVILVPGATRVIRSQALSIKELDYTLAARSIGASSTRIIFRHMLPNVAATYIVLITLTLGFAIVVEAALSFLGVGIPPDVATWGSMLELGREHIDKQGWMVVFPGIVIALVVFSVNFLGDGLRDVMDPKLRGR